MALRQVRGLPRYEARQAPHQWLRQPIVDDDPLWAAPGITITPHIAARSSPVTVAAQFVAGLRCLQRGDPPTHKVDRRLGY